MKTCLIGISLAAMVVMSSDWALAQEAQRSTDPSESWISTGEVSLYARAVGQGHPAIVLHGGPDFDHGYLLPELDQLADIFRLIYYDQRGRGRSAEHVRPEEVTLASDIEDVDRVRQHFRLEAPALLGHSWGSAVAALYAMHHPERVRSLIVVDGIPLRQSQLTEAFQQLWASRDSVVQSRMIELWEARVADPGNATICRDYLALYFVPFFADSTAVTRSTGDFCAGSPEALRNQMDNVGEYTEASLGEWDWRASLREFSAPTLIVHGTADPLPVEGAREWAEVLPNSRLLLLEGVGHFPYLEAPERFFSAVEEFLQGGWPDGAVRVGGE